LRFVLFDRIVELEIGQRAVLIKNISYSEDYFTDHFPGYPIVPGSIILGSFEQGAEILLASGCDFSLCPVLRRVSKARFKRFVVPGDQLTLSLVVEPDCPTAVQASAQVKQDKVATARLDFLLEQPNGDIQAREACERLRLFYQLLTSGPLSKAWDLWERQA
jgi:3-hydroxymyristoyl/3-hydroxydecanoyl-(acyl carrier protein) dehydratase